MQMPLFVPPLHRLVAKIGFPLQALAGEFKWIWRRGEILCLNKITRLLERGSEKGKASCFAQDWIWKVQHSAVRRLNRLEVWEESREKFCRLNQVGNWQKQKEKEWNLNSERCFLSLQSTEELDVAGDWEQNIRKSRAGQQKKKLFPFLSALLLLHRQVILDMEQRILH